jgi:hypothetical protein
MRTSVMATGCLSAGACSWTNGFSMMCAVASAAESVMVMMKPVAAKPRRTRTKSFPFQRESKCSSIEMEPSPCGLASATRLYIGSAPKSVRRTRTRVATGEMAPAAM